MRTKAQKISEILLSATDHGIDPHRYHIDQVNKILDKNFLKSKNKEKKQIADKILSHALWLYLSDLNGEMITADQFLNVVFSNQIKQDIQKYAPDSNLYEALQDRLKTIDQTLQSNKNDSKTIQKIIFEKKLLRPGDRESQTPVLRARLIDYLPENGFSTDPLLYDDFLVSAVKKFQAEHSLRADGIIGPTTLKHLNRTPENERKQILINLERLREPLYRNRPATRIEVDIARYWLTAYEHHNPIRTMPVIVGTPSRPTDSFVTELKGVRLNPGWTVPPTIKEEDYIPKLRENPAQLSEQGIRIYADWSKDSEPLDPNLVDWSLLSDNDIKAMRMFKTAGSSNPLGRYRFLMPSRYDIYLHDTNRPDLFSLAMRAQSSGCVRVKDPRWLVEFLLRNEPAWTAERLDSKLDIGETYDLIAKQSIPVYMDYKTAWINEKGQLILAHDIYSFDEDSYSAILEKDSAIKDYINTAAQQLDQTKVSETDETYSQDSFPFSLF